MVRLWLLQAPVPREHADRALPGLVEPLEAAGLLETSGGETRARVDVRPYADDTDGGADWWVVSDLTPGLDGAGVSVSADHVLGISSASTSLAQLTVREPVARALDLGTGCGVQALHLARHVGRDRRHRRQRARAGDDPAERRPQRGRRRRPGGQPVRAGRRGAVRPGRHQPAVRGLPGHRRAAGLPRLGPARRRDGPPGGHRRPATPEPGRLGPGARELGAPARRAVAGPGRRLAGRPGLRRVGGAAGGRRPRGVRRAVAQGRRRARPPRLPPAVRRLAVVVRGAGHRGRGLRLAAPAQGRPRAGAAPGGVALRRRAAARPRGRRARPSYRPAGRHRRRGAARAPAGDPGRRAPGDPRGARRGRPGDDRAAPAAGDATRAAGRHRGGRSSRRLRRRPDRRADPGRPRHAPGRGPGDPAAATGWGRSASSWPTVSCSGEGAADRTG